MARGARRREGGGKAEASSLYLCGSCFLGRSPRPRFCVIAEARILREYGMLYLRKGEPERARKRLSAALDIFRQLGAGKDVEQAGQALMALDLAH